MAKGYRNGVAKERNLDRILLGRERRKGFGQVPSRGGVRIGYTGDRQQEESFASRFADNIRVVRA